MSILELKDVCYSYSAEKPVLRGMNCTFEWARCTPWWANPARARAHC